MKGFFEGILRFLEAIFGGSTPPQRDTPKQPQQPRPRPDVSPPISGRIGLAIVDLEARRDANGNLKVYKLPANDGGGAFEIAGINSKYHPEALSQIMALPPEQRDKAAGDYIEDYTRRMTGIELSSALRDGTEFFVLDTTFNRGGGGSAWIVQTALRALGHSVIRDRQWGPKTRAALQVADQKQSSQIVRRLREAREQYERDVVGYRANFWRGLVNRWDKAAKIASEWNNEEMPAPIDHKPTQPTYDSGDYEPPQTIHLPLEGTQTLNAHYGTARPSADYLDWFSFPTNNIRLYTRSGAGLSDRTGNGLDDHRCHKAVKDALQAALREIYDTLGKRRFEKEGWHVYGGCYNYRRKRGGSNLSTHSWGIAIDINPGENGLRSSKTSFSDEAIDIMEKHGFLSGGRAWGRDYMHFQAAIPRVSSGSYYAKNGLPRHIKRT